MLRSQRRGLMYICCRGVMAAVMSLVCVLTCPRHSAADNSGRIQEAYRLGESDARQQLEDFRKGAEVERLRKAKAGEPPSTAAQIKEGFRAIKFLLYNRAATNGICAKMLFGAPYGDAAFEKFKACVEKRNAAMVKFLKLGEYSAIPNALAANCEMRGRDFENERQFPPFDFLQDGLGPALLDFETVNDCLLSGR